MKLSEKLKRLKHEVSNNKLSDKDIDKTFNICINDAAFVEERDTGIIKRLEQGRNYLMQVQANEITVEDALEAFGFGRIGTGGICKITNDKFNWVLEVDGKTITFNGSDNADYLAKLYNKLGYEVIWDRDKWKLAWELFS